MPSESTKEEKTILLLNTDEIRGLKRMPYAIRSIQLVENKIQINISYTGGCKSHDFDLVADRNIISKAAKNINFILSHDDNKDICKRIVNEKLVFDLSPLVKLTDVDIFKKDLKIYIDDRPIEKFLDVNN